MRRKINSSLMGRPRPYSKGNKTKSTSPVSTIRPPSSHMTSVEYIDALIAARERVAFPPVALQGQRRPTKHSNLHCFLAERLQKGRSMRNGSSLLDAFFHGSERIDEQSAVLRPSRVWEDKRLQASHKRHCSATPSPIPTKESVLRRQFQASSSKADSLWSRLEADFQAMN
jgi:hypothetical protein